MSLKAAAADVMKHLIEHEWHGYTQGNGRWGDGEGYCIVPTCIGDVSIEQGDRDCSSAIISVLRAVGIPTGNATYTGDMHDEFLGTGVWRVHYMSDGYNCDDGYIAQRGDIYLNYVNHTAMCSSAYPDMLYEFVLNEYGGIVGGQVGDQTGGESIERGFYRFPWDCVLEYIEGADNKPVPDYSFASGRYECIVDTLNVRDKPSLSGNVVAQYHSGEDVYLNEYAGETDGYEWGSYISYSGYTRYIAIRKKDSDIYLTKK